MVALRKRAPARMTLAEFLEWDSGDRFGRAWQLIDGEPVAMAPGIVPRVRANRNYRVPDVGVTRTPPSQNLMVADPVLLVEILSPSNEPETWANIGLLWR